MAFKKTWDEADIVMQLRRMAAECISPHNDGFTASTIKQDMLQIKFILEDLLAACPKFSDEAEWYQRRFIDKLK